MLLLVKNIMFTLMIPGTVGVYVPMLLVRDRTISSGITSGLALPVLVAGGSGYAWCLWDFATFGRGTPLPLDAPKRLVHRGLYRYVRNPMYVGVLAVILGWALLFRAPILVVYAAVVWACFHLVVVIYEEPHLRREFRGEYDEYCARVGRWLPRFPGA